MRNGILGLFRTILFEKGWKRFLEVEWIRDSAIPSRRLLNILGGILGLIALVLCAEYFGFFKMIDFYLYEDY